jgi:hypothetical protein
MPELIILADFPYPWASIAAEVDAMKPANNQWQPGEKDFDALATVDKGKAKILKASNLGEFLGAIQGESKGTISRVNLITHANNSIIALKGRVDTNGSVFFNRSGGLAAPLTGDIDLSSIQGLSTPDLQPTLEDARTRFSKGANGIFLYCCSAGGLGLMFGLILQEIANAFRVPVFGFSPEVHYCPLFTESPPAVVDRKRTSLKDCKNDVKIGFRHLIPNVKRAPKA